MSEIASPAVAEAELESLETLCSEGPEGTASGASPLNSMCLAAPASTAVSGFGNTILEMSDADERERIAA